MPAQPERLRIEQLKAATPMYFGRKSQRARDVHVLRDERGNPWMSDCGQERVYMGSVLPHVKRGQRVLTAGLGLALFTESALDRGAHVTVVEFSKDVIDAVHIEHPHLTLIQGDVKEFMTDRALLGRGNFDFTYLDIWKGANELELLDRYRCIDLARPITSGKVVCWQLWSAERGLKQSCRELDNLFIEKPNLTRKKAWTHASYGGFLLEALYIANPGNHWRSPAGFIRWLRGNYDEAQELAFKLFDQANKTAFEYWQKAPESKRQKAFTDALERAGLLKAKA